jgi:hypothetical protein
MKSARTTSVRPATQGQTLAAVARPTPGLLAVAVGALASTLLVACGPTMSEAAQKAFAEKHPGCPATVRERRDLMWGVPAVYSPGHGNVLSSTGNAHEVTGCNSDVLYECSPETTWVAFCVETDWCTPDGCDSVELAARNAFVNDKACPVERVSAATRAPVQPAAPADVAADPDRMRVWTQAQQERIAGHTFMTATGCGSETVYDCKKPPATRAIPACVATSFAKESAASGSAPVPTSSGQSPTPPATAR